MTRIVRFLLIYFIFYILYFILSAPLVHAQVSPTLSISPSKYDIVVTPGQLQQVQIAITNRSDVAIPLKAVSMDFGPKGENGEVQFDQPIPDHSGKTWLSSSPADLLLKPNESKTVTVTISTPETISPGSYFGVMMFQSELPSNYFAENDQAHIVPWIGTLFLMRVGDIPAISDSSFTITAFNTPTFSIKRDVPVTLEIRNNTPFHLAPKTVFELKNLVGGVSSEASVDDAILPGSARIIQGRLTSSQLFGLYRTNANVSLSDWHKQVSHPLYLLSGLGVIILILLAMAARLLYLHGRIAHHHIRRRMGRK
jgi:hypothetical protein